MKKFYLVNCLALLQLTLLAQSFTFPTSGNAVNGQLAPLVAPDGVTLVTSIRSTGCTPGSSSTFRYSSSHVSTGAIYRNTSWAAGCINSTDIILMNFSTVSARPSGLRFNIHDVDNGSDSVSVQIYSAGNLVPYTYALYASTFVTAHGASPSYGFVGSGSNNSELDDNRGTISIASIDPMVKVDSVVIYKRNNRNISGNPSQSFAGFLWNHTATLPVTLLSFSALQHNHQIQCSWKAAEESGTSYYQIEYAADGRTFTTDGNKIQAKGTRTGAAEYAHNLSMPFQSQLLFVRLVSTDFDGKKFYSKTIKISQDKQLKVTAYPTLFQNNISVQIDSENTGRGTIKLIGINGAVVHQRAITVQKGSNALFMEISDTMPKGMYVLTGELENGKNFRVKLIKE